MAVISDRVSTTLGEYLILPRHSSRDLSAQTVSLKVPLTKYAVGVEKPKLFLNVPFLSAAMQSVTGARMAIALAKRGGLGVIPCSQKPESQAAEIKSVKSEKSGFVRAETISPDTYIGDVVKKIRVRGYSSFPVTQTGKLDSKLLGLITKSDFSATMHAGLKVRERMIPVEELIFGYEDEIKDIKSAEEFISKKRISALPIVDKDLNLRYVVFRKDLDIGLKPDELLDGKNRYVVGAAINTKDYENRVPLLIEAGADILFIDSSNGLRDFQRDAALFVKQNFPLVPLVAGNFVTAEGFKFAVRCGADAVKIGMGPGSICITQDQKGVGRGQATAIREIADARDVYFKETGVYVPLIADGGVEFSRHMIVALALGADIIMMGKWFARFDESAGPKVKVKDEWKKMYWGEGSGFAKQWREERYGQSSFEEGIVSYVPSAGSIRHTLELSETVDKIKSALIDTGSKNIFEFHKNAILERVSQMAVAEGSPHGVTAVREDELVANGLLEK